MIDTGYLDQIQSLRDTRDQRLKNNPQSWLALIGLFRLEEGDNSFGADGSNKISLPEFGQARCGTLQLEDGKISLLVTPNSDLAVNGLPFKPCILHTDHDESPDRIQLGSLTMMILLRGQDYYLRVWDADSPEIKNFTGLKYFPIKSEYRISAEFIPYELPRGIKIQDVLGTGHDTHLFGEAHFEVNGNACILVAEEDEDELLFSFTDKTREDLTYPGGRFLTTKKPDGDRVVLDFNLAFNWPCAYTAFATCPLPPAENRLSVRIEAGEMRYKEH